LAHLNHDNVIKYYEYFTDRYFFYVVYEYCQVRLL
jgi:serine/threonine protein kinase